MVRVERPLRGTFIKGFQEMPTYPIFHRWSARLIAMVEAETYPRALELAVARGVRMLYADLEGVKVRGTSLTEGDFRGAELSQAELTGVHLERVDLRAARLVGTDLRQAFLRTADLRQADLRGADLRFASLEGAQLVGADLRGALLTGTRLERAILDWRWSPVAVELLAPGWRGIHDRVESHGRAGVSGGRAAVLLAQGADPPWIAGERGARGVLEAHPPGR